MKRRRIRKDADLDFQPQPHYPQKVGQNSFQSGQFLNQKNQPLPLHIDLSDEPRQEQAQPEQQGEHKNQQPDEPQLDPDWEEEETPYPFLQKRGDRCMACLVLCPRFAVLSFTFAAVVAMLALYVGMSVVQMTRPESSLLRSCTLYAFKAKFVPSIKARREYYRVLLPFLYHSSVAHLIVDLIPLALYGFTIEHFFRKELYLGLPLAMVGAGLGSCLLKPGIVSVTASALTYQVLGLQGLFIFRFRGHPLLEGKKVTLLALYLILLGMGLLPVFTDVNVDASGPVAGLLVGLALGLAFWPVEARWYHAVRAVLALLLAGSIVAMAVVLAGRFNGEDQEELAGTIAQLCSND